MKNLGVSLMEVLVSMLLISIVLLGFDAMEIESMREAKIQYFYHIAVLQMGNLQERLIGCKTFDEIQAELNAWNTENQSVLPQGLGIIEKNLSGYRVKLQWGKLQICNNTTIGISGCLIQNIYMESR